MEGGLIFSDFLGLGIPNPLSLNGTISQIFNAFGDISEIAVGDVRNIIRTLHHIFSKSI